MNLVIREEKLLSNPNHIREVSDFECDVEDEALVEYIKGDAFKENRLYVTRTYLIKNFENKIIGYYSLKTSAISFNINGINKVIPLLELSEFAIDTKYQRKGFGTAIMIDYIYKKLVDISNLIGCSGIITFAKDNKALSFYKKLGFDELNIGEDGMIMCDNYSIGCKPMIISTETIKNALE